jgi:hypothetical protein
MQCTRIGSALVAAVLAVACGRGDLTAREVTLPIQPEVVRCTLMQFGSTSPGYPGPWSASYRVTNGTRSPIVYTAEGGSPEYVLEIRRDGNWSRTPGGPSYYPFGPFCGTNMRPRSLGPGESLVFWVSIPGDGETYRARFGEPPVVTDPIAVNL